MNWRRVLLVFLGLLMLIPLSGEAQGIITGTVRDTTGRPLADVQVSVRRDTLARETLTGLDGQFIIEGLAGGEYAFEARKVGYRAAEARVSVPRDSAVIVNITLVGDAQALPRIVVEAKATNRVRGLTTDRADKPVAGVVLEIIGLGLRDTTDAEGRFEFNDLDPGLYLMQARKTGYAVAQTSIRMVDRLERDFAIRMLPIGRSRYTAEMAAIVAIEGTRRQGLAGGGAAIVGRDELERYGKTRLDVALAGSSAAVAFKATPAACLVVDGYAVEGTGGIGMERPTRPPRGVRSIHTEGQAIRGALSGPTKRAPPALAPPSWLGHYRADEVEMVEIYPEGEEHSRTLCGRFSRSSGCSCPPEPAGFVIWLR